MFVFSSWGVTFEFLRQEDGSWLQVWGGAIPTAGGTLYTADPYGPEPYPSRLMLTDGTVAEPVYEAHFSTGYIPLFAFDITGGKTYHGLLFGVDESGGLRYGLRTTIAIPPEAEMPAAYNQDGYFTQYTAAQVYGTADGPDFFEAFRDWRASVWAAEPTTVTDTAYLGVGMDYLLYAEYLAPPSLSVDIGSLGVPDEWGMNEFSDTLYARDDGLRYVWNMTCSANILPLLYAGEVTPELLCAAAQGSVVINEYEQQGPFITMEASVPYGATRVWDGVTVPEAVLALSRAVRSELD